jgi:hypothetical protein
VKCWISRKIGSEKDSVDTRFKHVFSVYLDGVSVCMAGASGVPFFCSSFASRGNIRGIYKHHIYHI